MARTPAAKRGSTPVKSEAKLAKAKKVLETPSPRKSPRKGSAAAAEPDQEEREPVSTPALDPEAKSADAQPAKASTSKAIKETPASKEKKSKAAPVVPPPRPPPTVFAPGVGDGKSLVLASWNVNGLKAILSKDPKPIETFLQEYNPDVLCLQETKCGDGDIPAHAVFKGYQAHWSGGVKKGYAGTGMLTKNKPLKVTFGIGQKKHDEEGRVITAEFDSFFLVNAYVPNSGQELKRLPYRTNEWEPDMVTYLRSLDARKPVVYCGDLNAAHHPIDVTYPTRWSKNAGFTPVERACLSTLLADTPLVDSFRHFHPDTIKYSYFGYRGDCRAKHVGWRLDYFLVSPRAMAQVQESDILHQTTGSDHTPIVMRCTL